MKNNLEPLPYLPLDPSCLWRKRVIFPNGSDRGYIIKKYTDGYSVTDIARSSYVSVKTIQNTIRAYKTKTLTDAVRKFIKDNPKHDGLNNALDIFDFRTKAK